LARAVIGGLFFATFATLVFVPIMFRLLPHKPRAVLQTVPPVDGTGAGEPHALA
jgi:hypothetical protein